MTIDRGQRPNIFDSKGKTGRKIFNTPDHDEGSTCLCPVIKSYIIIGTQQCFRAFIKTREAGGNAPTVIPNSLKNRDGHEHIRLAPFATLYQQPNLKCGVIW